MSFLEENVIHEKSYKKLRRINHKPSSFVEDREVRNLAEEDLITKCLSASFFAIKKFVDSIKFAFFKENFKDIYEINPGHLKSIYEQFQEQIFHRLQEDANEIYNVHETSFSLSPYNEFSWKNKCDKINRRCHQTGPIVHSCHEERQKWNSKLRSYNEEREDEMLKNHEHILILGNKIQTLNKKIMEELDKLYEITLQVSV